MILPDKGIFVCDTLQLLERLPNDTVSLVYLDPPWIIDSDFKFDNKSLVEPSKEYVSFLSKVVQQVYRVLDKRGNLFVHWSINSLLDVRLMVNQAFGEQPKYEIILHKRGSRYQRYSKPRIDNESILAYSKSQEYIYNPIIRPLLPDEMSAYNKKDKRGNFKLVDLTVSIERPVMCFEWRGYQLPPERSWRFTFDKLEALDQENKIYFPVSGLPKLKQYIDENAGVELGLTWDDISFNMSRRERRYPSQQPLVLLERLIKLGSNKGDLVFDPFFGSGTTLIAAQLLDRRWWGSDKSEEALQITMARLLEVNDLKEGKDFNVFNDKDIKEFSVVNSSYRDIITDISGIVELQREIKLLTDHLLSLKKMFNIGENADEQQVHEVIKQMEQWITRTVSNKFESVDSYIDVVRAWLDGWDKLDKSSQLFLPQAELLFDSIISSNGQDFSPFIIQYCRALENELLTKLFITYSNDLFNRKSDINEFLSKDLADDKLKKFANSLLKHKTAYTLGEMNFIMGLMKAGGETLKESPLLQDFRSFTIRYFNEQIVDKAYLDQIDRINKDFRCKAAHPYVLDIQVAHYCREQVRACLNKLIMNYQGEKLV